MAERVGFEPTVRFPAHTISNRAPSASSDISPPIDTRPFFDLKDLYHKRLKALGKEELDMELVRFLQYTESARAKLPPACTG